MDSYRYVVVGGGIAGGRACEGIRKADSDGSVALVAGEQHVPYQRPPLSKKYLRGEVGLERVYLEGEDYYDEKNIELMLGVSATGLDVGDRALRLGDGSALRYDRLLLATGGSPRTLSLQGGDLENVFTLRTIGDSDGIGRAREEAERALVLGGSFIGAEVSASLAEAGLQVTQAFPDSRLLERIAPEELGEQLHDMYQSHGVRLLPGTICRAFEGNGRVERAKLDSGETIDVDLVVMGVGIRLATELARDAGLELRNGDDAIVVDELLRTSNPHVYAAGDIAAWPDATFERRLRVEHWDVARRQGLRAGLNMAGEEEPYTALPYFFSDLFDLSFEVWGNLSAWDRTVLRGSLEKGSYGYYFFDDDRLTGVLAVGRPDEERVPMQSLVEARPHYDEVVRELADESVNLEELLDQESASGTDEGSAQELSFRDDIRPLFRDKDVREMKDLSGFDLSDLDDVRERARSIHARLADGSMPCDEPWPEDRVARFGAWIEQGKQP